MRRIDRNLVLLAALAALLAGCGSGPTARPSGALPAAEPGGGWRGRADVQEAIALLNRGSATDARRRLMSALRRDPADAIARDLLAQIDGDPQAMLGAQSYAYTLREGETLSTIAARALGNPMKFYILARYNNIAVPQDVHPGQEIRIPGHRPAPPPSEHRAQPQPQPPRTEPTRPAPAPAPAPAPRPAANPALAQRLRTQGLAALNAGAVNRAVALLRQAAAADPGNAAIRANLAQALRVQRTVHARQ
jgi:predicted Zn-dependent protease